MKAGTRLINPKIDLSTPLSLRSSFRFPLQSDVARKEVLIGAVWLLVPVVGWVLNMGHRIVMVHQMMRGEPAWPAWRNVAQLARHGTITLMGMIYYYTPAAVVGIVAYVLSSLLLAFVAGLLLLFATLAIPGFMSHYCRSFDPREIFNPLIALRRCWQGGRGYWHAWGIAMLALAISFLGLIAFGVGFLVTSVWFWQVAGFSFASVFASRFSLREPT